MFENKVKYVKKKEEDLFPYFHEILPDFQKRTKSAVNEAWSDPKESEMRVGMEKINAQTLMGKYFVEFASNSSIHGLNHLVARNRHPLERILTVIFILGALASLIFVSMISWYRYQNDAIAMYWDYQYELFRLVKPSLLLCPTNVIQESKFPITFERYGIQDTPKARAFFHFLSNVSYANMIDTPEYDEVSPQLWLRILNDLKREFNYETTFSGTGIWVATENGLCVSIGNYVLPYASLKYLITNNWTVSPLPTYPPDFVNYQMDNTKRDMSKYVPSYTYDDGHGKTEYVKTDAVVMLSIIDPMDSYKMSNKYLLQILELQNVVLKILQIDIAKGIDKLSVHRRKCGFPWDKGLTLWPIYTFEMCVTECRSRIIRKNCACTPHFLRRIPDVPVCDAKQLRCIGRIKESLDIGPPYCNCLQNCNKVLYVTGQNRTTTLKEGSPINTTNFKMVVDFTKSKYKRTERYTFGGFLTSVGGAAGLFLGCSVLSFVEIFYYMTLHLYIYIRRRKHENAKLKTVPLKTSGI